MTMIDFLVSRGHKYEDILVEIHYRVRHGYKNEIYALAAMVWDEINDWGFTYLSKRNLSVIEWWHETRKYIPRDIGRGLVEITCDVV